MILRRIFLSLFACGALLASPSAVFAQPAGKPYVPRFQTDEATMEKYMEAVDKVYKRNGEGAQVLNIRTFYTYTKLYDPFGETVLRKIATLVEEIEKEKDEKVIQEKLDNYEDIIRLHIGNFEVVKMAYLQSAKDVRFGNPSFYKDIYKAMVNLITKNIGDGKTVSTAYVIYTKGEEDYLLSKVKAKRIKSELVDFSSKFYNVHDFQDSKGKKFTIYMDVTIPIMASNEKSKQQGSLKKK